MCVQNTVKIGHEFGQSDIFALWRSFTIVLSLPTFIPRVTRVQFTEFR